MGEQIFDDNDNNSSYVSWDLARKYGIRVAILHGYVVARMLAEKKPYCDDTKPTIALNLGRNCSSIESHIKDAITCGAIKVVGRDWRSKALRIQAVPIKDVLDPEDFGPPNVFREPAYTIEKERTRRELSYRDGYQCYICGSSKEGLHVHRVVPGKLGGKYEVDNTILVCNKHHRTVEGKSWEEIKRYKSEFGY